MYPSLLSKTAAVYFLDWPEEALRHIAFKSVSECAVPFESEVIKKTVDILVQWHTSVKSLAEKCHAETRSKIYITPVEYTGMLAYFNELLTRKQSLTESQIQKYSNGVKCLEEAAVLVQKLSIELESMKPGLELKNKETEKTMSVSFRSFFCKFFFFKKKNRK